MAVHTMAVMEGACFLAALARYRPLRAENYSIEKSATADILSVRMRIRCG
jgi:hypothetical protein